MHPSPLDAKRRPTLVRLECIDRDRLERLRSLVVATRLDNVISNADLVRAVASWGRAETLDRDWTLARTTIGGDRKYLPLDQVARRWQTPHGRDNLRRDMTKRMNRLMEVHEYSPERFKLFTVTFRGVEESWRAAGFIRNLVQKVKKWAERRGRTITYIWVAELQKRAALHYHIVISNCPYVSKGQYKRWARAPQCKMEEASPSTAGAYLAKYLRKATASNPKSGDLANLLFCAARKRHFGSSRLISFREPNDPPWIKELNELLNDACTVESYSGDPETDTLTIYLTNGMELEASWTRLNWTLVQLPNNGAPDT